MNPLILILASESGGPANTWIQANAPAFFRPGHDIVATDNPTDEQIRAAYAIVIPEARSYFAIVGRAMGKNIVFLDADVDSRDFIPGGTHVRKTLHLCDWMLGTALAIARAERAAAEAMRAELAEKDAEITRLYERINGLAAFATPVGSESSALLARPEETVKKPNEGPSPKPLESGPLPPESAAKVEFEAGHEIALAGGTLPDLATDAAVSEPAPDAPAEPTPATSSVEPAGVKKTIRDIRRKPSLPAE